MNTEKNPIAKFLEDNERTAAWLARQTGLCATSVTEHVRNMAMPSLHAIQQYHRVTGIPLEVLAMAWTKSGLHA